MINAFGFALYAGAGNGGFSGRESSLVAVKNLRQDICDSSPNTMMKWGRVRIAPVGLVGKLRGGNQTRSLSDRNVVGV